MAFDASKSKLLRGAANPAAPAGLRQTQERMVRNQERYEEKPSMLRPWQPKESMLETAKSWYGGANTEGISNGWDTDFYRNTFAQIDEWQAKAKSAERGSVFYSWLDTSVNPRATGVATWDDEAKDIRFGDVFNDGKKVGNLYEDYDQATADVMIGEFFFSNDEKARMFESPDRNRLYREEVEKRRQENTDRALYSKSAEDYDRNVEARERALHEGLGNERSIAASTAASAAAGAGAGAVLTSWLGPGAAIGAIGGGILGAIGGFVGGYLNQDQLVELEARAAEKVDMANKRFSGLQAAGIALGEYSSMGMRYMAPASNVVQGLAETREGEKIGDMESAFYAVDENGNRKVGSIWQGADIAATLGDSVLQFSSPLGRWMYMSTMSGTIVGGVSELTTGTVFNDRRGDYDQLENWQEWTGALGSTGIDVVQLGIAGAFTRAAQGARAAATPGASSVSAAGIRFGMEGTKVVSARASLELLAPSEFLRWIPAGWKARRLARIDGGAVTRDHLYRAAMDTVSSGSRFRDAIIMGYAEGGEEFAQALLDPMATGDSADWGEVFRATLYGAATGGGMAMGAVNRRPDSRALLEARAYVNVSRRNGREPSEQEWSDFLKSASLEDIKRLAIASPQEAEEYRGVLETYAQLHAMDTARASAIGAAAAEDYKASKWSKMYRRALEEGNGSLVLMGMTSNYLVSPAGTMEGQAFPPNSALMSAWEAVNQLRGINEGFAAQLKSAEHQLVASQRALGKATQGTDEFQRHTADVARLSAIVDDLTAQSNVTEQLLEKFRGLYEQFSNETDPDAMEQRIDEMNLLLRSAFTGQWRNPDGSPTDTQRIKRAVELKLARHPLINTGSFSLLMPQISVELTKMNAHGTVYMHQATLKALGADHDGDTGVPQHSVYLPDAELQALRRGADQYVRTVEKGGRTQVVLEMDAPDGEARFISVFSDAYKDPTSPYGKAVEAHLSKLVTDIRNRYRGSLPRAEMDRILRTFKEGVLAGQADARMTMANALFNLDTQELLAMADDTHVPEALWLMGRVNETWDLLQKQLAHLTWTDPNKDVPVGEPSRLADETTYLKGRAVRSAGRASTNLALLAADPVRGSQFLHYAMLWRSATETDAQDSGYITQLQTQLTELFLQLGSGMTQPDVEAVRGRNAVEQRVVTWLQQMAERVEGTTKSTPEVLMLMANTAVPDIQVTGTNEYTVGNERITLLQLLLRRSLEIEERLNYGGDPESDAMKRIAKLKKLTRNTADAGGRSATASLALMEVFGNRQLHELLGDDALFLSPQMTLNQLKQQLQGMHPRKRNQVIHLLERSPAYISTSTVKDPPWSFQVLQDAKVNAFSMLVDTVATASRLEIKNMVKENDRAHANFINGITGLHALIAAHRAQHSDRLSQGTDEVSRIAALRDLLETRPDIADRIAKQLIPEAAFLGIFRPQKDGSVQAARWVEKMLVSDPEKAAVMYFVHTKLAEFNVAGGTVDTQLLDASSDVDTIRKAIQDGDVRGKVRQGRLQSRFLQMVYHLASQPDGIELSRLLKAAAEAPSLAVLFKEINETPAWRNNQERLLPWHDDVSVFQVDPKDVWNSNLPGALQRENLRGWGQQMSVLGQAAVEAQATLDSNRALLGAMQTYLRTSRDPNVRTEDGMDASTYVGLLEKALQNRRRFPDTNGQVVRDKLIELIQVGLPQMQNKGVADDLAKTFGESLITLDSYGFSDGLLQEMASITAEGVRDVRTNLTLLTEGPTRIMARDGSVITVDFSTVESALTMLADPLTQGLAIAVLFPTVRDSNSADVVQTYLDTDAVGRGGELSIADMLKEQTFVQLFKPMASSSDEVQQAHRYIGTVESYVRRQALGVTDPDERARAFFPIQNMIHDFVVAYTHSPKMEGQDPRVVRDRLIVDVANALKAVANVAPENRPRLQDLIVGAMEKVYGGDSTQLDEVVQGDAEKKLITAQLRQQQARWLADTLHALDKREEAAETANDTAALDAIQEERERVVELNDLMSGKSTLAMPRQRQDVASVLEMFTVTGDKALDGAKKAAILEFLGQQNRINRFQTKDRIDLYHRARRLIYQNPINAVNPASPMTTDEWKVLGSWAATMFISDYTSRSSSDVPMLPLVLGPEGATIRRYFDHTWSYLVEPLFDPTVLEAAVLLAQSAQRNNPVTLDEAKDVITRGLLHDDKLGEWTDRIPMESMKARKVLLNSPVGAALSQEGNDPKVLADYVGAGRVSWKLPDPATHVSTATLNGAAGQRLADLITTDHAYVKLQNHFVSRIRVVSTDPNIPYDEDLLDVVGDVNFTHASIENSPYRVLDLTRLDAYLDMLRTQMGLGGYQLEIDYVDVDKMPHSREWANNIYFEGVGREAKGGAGLGAVASLFFGLGGLSKVGQQNPLDSATKKGKEFRAHKRSPLSTAANLERAGAPIAEVLAAKAVHLLRQHYPMGDLYEVDLPSLYKLMKMRHIVVGKLPGTDEVVRWWPQQVIEAQTNGTPVPLDDMELVPLSNEVAQTLLGGAGHMGVRGALTRPVLNLQDMDVFPSLDNARLASLGLSNLGLPGDVQNSELTQVTAPPVATFNSERGKRLTNHIQQRLEAWRGQAQEVLTQRSMSRASGEGKFDIGTINSTNAGILYDLMKPPLMVRLFQKLGVPQAGLMDMAAMDVSSRIARQIDRLMESDNNVVWVYEHNRGGDPTGGRLGAANIKNNFAGMNGQSVTFGDVVVINLSSILNATGDNHQQAFKEARSVIEALASRGVMITLQSEKGEQDLMSAVSEWIEEGSLGYEPMQGSDRFFAPVTDEAARNSTRKALESTLLAVQPFSVKNLALRFVSDQFSTGLSESTEYIDLAGDPAWRSISHTLLPYDLLGTGDPGDWASTSYNVPIRGMDAADQMSRVSSKLRALLATTEGTEYLKGLFGKENPDIRYRKVLPNGTIEPGVLPLDDALVELRNTLEAGAYPLDTNQTVQTGTIVPVVSGNGSIFLARVGFKIPDMGRMVRQHETLFEDAPMKIAASSPELDDNQTLPPPFKVSEWTGDIRGLSVFGTYEQGDMAKMVSEGIGLKAGLAPMPKGLRFPKQLMKAAGAAGVRVSRIMSRTSVIGKEARPGMIDSFREAFVLTGISFKEDLVDFFYGAVPGDRPQGDFEAKWDIVQTILTEWSKQRSGLTAEDIARGLDDGTMGQAITMEINAIATKWIPTWSPVEFKQDPNDSANKRLVTIILSTLAAPGVELSHVVETAGMMTIKDPAAGTLVQRMPALMTDALNDPRYPALRTMLFERINANMPRDPKNPKQPLQWFDHEFNFHMVMEQDIDGTVQEEEHVGMLQIHMPIPADENSVRLVQAAQKATDQVSTHITRVVNAAVGGYEMPRAPKEGREELPDVLDEFFGDNEVLRFEQGDGSVFMDMLTRVLRNDRAYTPWERNLPMADLHYERADAKVRQYTTVIDRADRAVWTDEAMAETDRLAFALLAKLNLDSYGVHERDEVDFLVRQFYGRPGPAQDQEDYREQITPDLYREAVVAMTGNVTNDMHPLHGAAVPLEHLAFWRKLFLAQQRITDTAARWAPVADGNTGRRADTWGEWVVALHGQMRQSNEQFHSMFRTDLDGFYHTYQGSTPDFLDMPLSTSEKVAAKLMDPDINRLYLSVDPGEDALLRSPVVINSMTMDYDALVGNKPVANSADADATPYSELYAQLEAQMAWLRGEGMASQKKTSAREYARNGTAYQESARQTNNLMRNMINLSITMRLFNPALYVSAIFEVGFRSQLENITNILTGQHTGALGSSIAAAGARAGIQSRFTPDEIRSINKLIGELGESNRFLGELYGELTYQSVVAGGRGKVGDALEWSATAAAKATSDPNWGMRADTIARRYVDAAWEYLSMTDNAITVDQFVQLMEKNPLWLKEQSPKGKFSAHQAGLNRVGQARGTKNTLLAKTILSPVNKMTGSSSTSVNMAGHFLKIPFLFARFNANMFLTLSGLGAFDQAAAMFLDERQRPGVLRRMSARAKLNTYDPSEPDVWEMSDVLESIDLSRAFVRGAVTQTGLMAAGMLAGQLGLGGEDDEERKRKRLATYLNTPNYLDPRRAANDFRWKDAIFLDNIPVLSNLFRDETGHSAVVPHWIFRQFLSPVLGMQRFFETGNFDEVTQGFWDSASVMPYAVMRLWNEAKLTSDLLAQAAVDADMVPEKSHAVTQLFINTVAVYEKALIENSFVNSLMVARDEFDRNPWAIQQRDEATGKTIVLEEGTGLPMPTEALQGFQTEGEDAINRVGYATRNGTDAYLHQYAENNATAAVLLSILPWVQGQDSSYLRQNMVPKKVRVQVDETDKATAEALVMRAFYERGGTEFMTKEEIGRMLQAQDEAAGIWWNQADIEARADAIYSAMNENVLSTLDEQGRELLTKEGATGIFKSLNDKIIDFKDPVLAGVTISKELRDEIAEEWTTQLVQEGVDLGLSDTAAKYRMRRIWYGDSTDPNSPGLRALLYSKEIASEPFAEYNQLNVTYVIGPDGKPWATPFTRQTIAQAFGIPIPHRIREPKPGMGLDERGNSVDLMRGINTGQAALAPTLAGNDVEDTDDIAKKADAKTYTPGTTPYGSYRRWRRRGGYGGGGGGYSSSGYGPNFQRMLPLPGGTAARPDDIPMINTNTPYVRRADVRRERISSERGRLKQWQ